MRYLSVASRPQVLIIACAQIDDWASTSAESLRPRPGGPSTASPLPVSGSAAA